MYRRTQMRVHRRSYRTQKTLQFSTLFLQCKYHTVWFFSPAGAVFYLLFWKEVQKHCTTFQPHLYLKRTLLLPN